MQEQSGWRGALVDFSKIHAISKLQAGNLLGMELHFQIRLQNGDVERFTFSRTRAFRADAVQFQVTVMRFYEFIYDRVHGMSLF